MTNFCFYFNEMTKEWKTHTVLLTCSGSNREVPSLYTNVSITTLALLAFSSILFCSCLFSIIESFTLGSEVSKAVEKVSLNRLWVLRPSGCSRKAFVRFFVWSDTNFGLIFPTLSTVVSSKMVLPHFCLQGCKPCSGVGWPLHFSEIPAASLLFANDSLRKSESSVLGVCGLALLSSMDADCFASFWEKGGGFHFLVREILGGGRTHGFSTISSFLFTDEGIVGEWHEWLREADKLMSSTFCVERSCWAAEVQDGVTVELLLMFPLNI